MPVPIVRFDIRPTPTEKSQRRPRENPNIDRLLLAAAGRRVEKLGVWSGGGSRREGGVCVKCGCFPSFSAPSSCPMPHAAVQRRRPCGLAAELTRVRAGSSACPPNPGRWQSREPIFSGPLSFPLCPFLARRNRTTARSGPVFPFPSLHGSGHATKLARIHTGRQTIATKRTETKKLRGGGPLLGALLPNGLLENCGSASVTL